MQKVRDKIMHLKLILAILVFVPATAFSTVTTFKGSDEMTGASWSGIKLTSTNDQASLYFVCDIYLNLFQEPSGTNTPRILFSHEEFIISSGRRFTLAYKIDDDEITEYYFRAKPDSKSGSLSEPDEDDYREFISNFVKGNRAFVRVWDFRGKMFTYKFNLSGIVKNLNALKGCYPQRR